MFIQGARGLAVDCLVPVRLTARPSRSIDFIDLPETNGPDHVTRKRLTAAKFEEVVLFDMRLGLCSTRRVWRTRSYVEFRFLNDKLIFIVDSSSHMYENEKSRAITEMLIEKLALTSKRWKIQNIGYKIRRHTTGVDAEKKRGWGLGFVRVLENLKSSGI